MIEFDQYYRKYGFNKLTHLLNPVVVRTSTMIYPFSSELHYFKITDAPVKMTKDDKYLKAHSKVFCNNILSYLGNLEGKFIKQNVQLIKYARSLCPDDRIRYIRPMEVNITIPRQAVTVYNYTSAQEGYRYKKSAWTNIWKYNNTVQTLLIKTKERLNLKNIFITYELPSSMPSRQTLEKFVNQMTMARARTLKDYRYINLLELWKFLTPSLKEKSWLDKYSKEEKIRINLLLTYEDKTCIVNLGLLESIIKEYNKEEDGISVVESIYGMLNSSIPLYSTYSLEDAKMMSKGSFTSTIAKKQFFILANNLINKNLNALDMTKALKDDKLEKIEEEKQEENNETISSIQDDAKLEEELDKIISQDFQDSDTLNEDEIELEEEEAKDVSEVLDGAEEKIEEDESDGLRDVDEDVMERDIKEVYNKRENISIDKAKDKITKLKDDNQITKSKSDSYYKTLEKQKELKYEVNGEFKLLTDILNQDNDQETDTIKNTEVNDIPSVFDKSFNKNKIKSMDKQYLENNKDKDIIRSIYNLQNHDYIIEDYDKMETNSILDNMEHHTVKIKRIGGRTDTLSFVIPKITEDGNFKMSGNTYRIRKQRVETPIRKISSRRVVLCSYYGKIFVDKAYRNNFSYGSWFLRQLTQNPKVMDCIEGDVTYPDIVVNDIYGKLSKVIKSFTYGKDFITFDYKGRSFDLTQQEINIIEDNSIIIGKTPGGEYIVLDNNSYEVYTTDRKNSYRKTYLESIYHFAGDDVDEYSGPVEFAAIKIGGDYVPLSIVLSYYYGLNNILKILKSKYFLRTKDTKPEEMKLFFETEDKSKYMAIRFYDCKLYIKRDFGVGDMILGGLLSDKSISETMFASWNSRGSFSGVYVSLDVSPIAQSEIKVLENLFIDPMTLSLLRELKEPETFKGLLFKSCELLKDYNFRHPNEITGQVIKGYERINGLLYKSMAKAISKYELESMFSNVKLAMDPYEVLKKIKDDSTTVNEDDLNPLAYIKQSEDTSYLGDGGRNVITMTKHTRSIHPTEVGIISEATKDNGQVGVTAYLTTDPNIMSVRGRMEPINVEKEGWGKIFSTGGLLAPFADKDDAKRLNFASIQGAHVISINEMRAPVVRTGYESIIPLRCSDKFAVSAKEDGEVISINKKYLEVQYTSESKTTKYPIKSWTSKEESGACYTYELAPNFNVGDKFVKDDTLLYNTSFFEPDIFYKGRVLYKQGTYITVAVVDDPETYEDSGAISYKLKNRLGIKSTKVKSIVVNNTDEILNMVKIGSFVKPEDILFTFMDKDSVEFSKDEKKLDKETLELLKDMRSTSPKAKCEGTIKDIVVYYNVEDIDYDITPSLREIINESDKRLKINKGAEGRVNSSYSIRGVPLEKNQIEIKIYIEVLEDMSLGDKAVFGNQLKFTVGDVFENEIKAEEDGKDIEALFSYTAIQNRIVNSPMLLGTSIMIMEKIEELAVEMYYN